MPRWQDVKEGAFVVFRASSFTPLLQGVQRYGLKYMLQYSGMKWYLLELTFYGTGVGLYAVCGMLTSRLSIPGETGSHSDEPSAVPSVRAFGTR